MENSHGTRIQLRDLSEDIKKLTDRVTEVANESMLSKYQIKELTRIVEEIRKTAENLEKVEASEKGAKKKAEFLLQHGIAILGWLALVINLLISWTRK